MTFPDIRFAIRMLLKNPAFTAVAVLSLAIGIGANSAIFSLADGLLLRPLPVLRPSEIVSVEGTTRTNPYENVSYRDFVDFRDRTRALDGLVAFQLRSFGFSATPDALPQVKYGFLVSGNLLRVLGVQPELGRGFRPDEDQAPGRDAVVILGHDFWEQQFGSDPSAVGRTIRLNGIEFTVIGVLPKAFTGMDQYIRPAMLVPVMMAARLEGNPARNPLEKRDDRGFQVKGRLKPGVSQAQAQADLAGIAKGLEQAYPATNHDQGVTLRTELQSRIERSPPDATLVAMLMSLSALVLLVACANVANLLLSRARARSREMAVRLAIGAGRARLVRQLLTESLLIGSMGGLVGLVVAYAGVRFLNRITIPSDLPILLTIQLDERVLIFSILASLASVLLFGLAPALQTSRTDLVPALKATDADSSGRQRAWGSRLLVVGQVALCLVLLVVSAMMYQGFRNELGAGPGFRTNHLLMMSFDPSLVQFKEVQTKQFYKQLSERAALVPGVVSASLTSSIPMSPNQYTETIAPEGYQFPKGKVSDSVFSSTVGEHFFETMGVSIVSGRGFQAGDSSEAPQVAVINEALAKKYWPNQDPLGKRFRLGDEKGRWVQVAGVAKTGKYLWIAEPPTEFFYLPLAQHFRPRMTLIAQTEGDPAGLIAPLREVVRGLDANQPIYDLRRMDDFYQKRAVDTPNLLIETVGSMGIMGLVLAMAGLYGLVAYSVSRRTREFGIRMAIGAGRGHVLRIVMRQGLLLALSGIGIGVVLSLGAARLVTATFVSARSEPWALAVVPPLLLAVTLLAAYLPALRASKVDPMKALRYE
jgi:predicted permease